MIAAAEEHLAAVKAMEEAMQARLAADAQQQALDKAMVDAQSAEQQAIKTSMLAENATEARAAPAADKDAKAVTAPEERRRRKRGFEDADGEEPDRKKRCDADLCCWRADAKMPVARLQGVPNGVYR